MEVKDEKFITAVEAKKLLMQKSKEKEELGYEQKNALEFLKKYHKMKEKDIEAMKKALSEITKLKERHLALIIDHLPKDLDDMKILFAHEIITLSDEEKKKILSIVKKYS